MVLARLISLLQTRYWMIGAGNLSVSNFQIDQLKEAQVVAKHPIISNEILYNYNDRSVEKSGLCEYCREKSVLLISYRSLGLGIVCGQEEDAEHGDSLLVSLAKKHEKTSGQMAFAQR